MQRIAKVQHYASLLVNDVEVCGIATLVPGGYSFKADDSHDIRLVSYKSSDLLLFGRCDIADAQWAEDCSHGDLLTLGAR